MGKINLIKFWLVLFLFCGISVYSQNYIVGFNVKFRPKLEDSIKISEKFNLNINCKTKESFFKSENLTESDFNANIFKDFTKKIFKKYELILYKFYQSDYLFSATWKLLFGEKQILGLNCQNASLSFGGRKWIAWYSTEIPVQDGPYKFSGLPGLILEINSTDNDYQFLATSIEKNYTNVKPMLAIPMGDIVKESKFKKNIINEPSAQYKQDVAQSNFKMTVTFNGKQSTNKEILNGINTQFWDWMKAHNNPIEKDDIWIK